MIAVAAVAALGLAVGSTLVLNDAGNSDVRSTAGPPDAAVSGPGPETWPTSGGEFEWQRVISPYQLAQLAQVVVVARPVSEEWRLSVARRNELSRTEWWATQVEVIDVLEGSAVRTGDVLVVVRAVDYQVVTINGEAIDSRLVGDGVPGPLDAAGYVLGLNEEPLTGEGDVWAVPAGAHGRVSLEGTDDHARILEPTDGSDGLLQERLAGQTLCAFKEMLLPSESRTALCDD